MGLFGYNQGIIKNLNLIDSYISSSGGYIGGITAFNNNSSIIENCHNYAHIVTNTSSGYADEFLQNVFYRHAKADLEQYSISQEEKEKMAELEEYQVIHGEPK